MPSFHFIHESTIHVLPGLSCKKLRHPHGSVWHTGPGPDPRRRPRKLDGPRLQKPSQSPWLQNQRPVRGSIRPPRGAHAAKLLHPHKPESGLCSAIPKPPPSTPTLSSGSLLKIPQPGTNFSPSPPRPRPLFFHHFDADGISPSSAHRAAQRSRPPRHD